ncbi:hypothetical protein [Clostridium sp.]|nr:hypothetical protein [Clostridium sp.]
MGFLFGLIITAPLVIIAVSTYICCIVAGRADMVMEKYHNSGNDINKNN